MDQFAQSEQALSAAAEIARRFVRGLGDRPVAYAVTPEELAARIDEPLPARGSEPGAVLQEWLQRAEPGIVASAGPRFFGFVNGGATPAALAGDWLASAIDQNAGPWLSSPAAAQTELTVLRWLKELFDLPVEWGGALTSGATMSNLVGLAAGRQWVGKQLGFDPATDGLGGKPAIPVVSSTEIHASALKALGTLGLGRGTVRRVAAPGGAVDLDALAAELARVDGPVLVVANAGEVNTGAFDDLAGVSEVCAGHASGAWLHVDAAFGIFAAASPRYRHLTHGIERADSVGADGHKWLNVPYDCGFAFVRDVDMLRQAFAATGAYIAPGPGAGWDPMSHLPEMSRRFRGLAAWSALKAWGREGYQAMVERCVENAQGFARWVAETPGVELLAPATLNIVCFRYTQASADAPLLDDLNRAATRALQAGGEVFVTGTVWQGRVGIRAAFDNWATTPADVDVLKAAVGRLRVETGS
ncbi:MAG: aspartate aminotransferase family protein [Chloroflexi bacterium]|nr:MAG: aspartate aminotransferase family protein [Chloroflexota bacterium]